MPEKTRRDPEAPSKQWSRIDIIITQIISIPRTLPTVNIVKTIQYSSDPFLSRFISFNEELCEYDYYFFITRRWRVIWTIHCYFRLTTEDYQVWNVLLYVHVCFIFRSVTNLCNTYATRYRWNGYSNCWTIADCISIVYWYRSFIRNYHICIDKGE